MKWIDGAIDTARSFLDFIADIFSAAFVVLFPIVVVGGGCILYRQH
jgi:hypothetical protein